MLRRCIFILVLLTITFFVYRKINPVGADALVHKARTTYNRILGRTGEVAVLTGNVLSGELLTGTLLTGTAEPAATELSGDIFTGSFASGDSEFVSGDIAPTTGGLLDNVDEGVSTGANEDVRTGDTSVTPSAQTTGQATTTTTKTTTKPRTSNETRDTQNLINSLFK